MARLQKLTLHNAGAQAVLKDPALVAMLGAAAEGIAARAGAGHKADTYVGKTRARGTAWASTPQAMARNRRHNLLLKALGGGAGAR